MIDSLLLLPQEAKRVSLFQKALFTRYLHLRASKGFYDAKIFTLQYKIFFPEFDEFNSTLGLLFFEKFITQSKKPQLKVVQTTNRLSTNVPSQWFYETRGFQDLQFLLNHRYATALILRRRKLQIQRKKTEKYLDFFVSDLNTLYPTRDIDTYGFRSTLQIRIINQLFLGKAGLSMFRL